MLQILEWMAVHHPVVIVRLVCGPKHAKHTSPEIQCEVIPILAEMKRKYIENELEKAKFFSIIVAKGCSKEITVITDNQALLLRKCV